MKYLGHGPHVNYTLMIVFKFRFLTFETGSQVAQASIYVVEEDREFLILPNSRMACVNPQS